MVHYICFCMMTPEFLRLPLEERQAFVPRWSELAKRHGLNLLFWGTTIGVSEHATFVFESLRPTSDYFKFVREWLELGTPDAGKLISYTRTVTVN